MLHSAYSYLFRDLAVILNMVLHILVSSAQYRGDSGPIQSNPANIRNFSYLFRNWIVDITNGLKNVQVSTDPAAS